MSILWGNNFDKLSRVVYVPEKCLRGLILVVAITKCPICRKFYKYGSGCECGFDEERINELLEIMRTDGIAFEEILMLIVYLYDLKVLKGTKLAKIVELAREILLEEVDSDGQADSESCL